MNNVRELERRWIRYKIKQYLPYTLLIVSLMIVSVITFSLTSLDKKAKKEETASVHKQKAQSRVQKVAVTEPIVKTKQKTPKSSSLPSLSPTNKVLPSKKESTSTKQAISLEKRTKPLEPSMDFLNKMKKNSIFPQEKTLQQNPITSSRHDSYIARSKKEYTSTKSAVSPKPKTVKLQKQAPKVTIKVKKTSKKELEEIIKRFKKNNNPRLGVFIARKYYEMGDYGKAYNYALLTNQIDSSLEDSWIIFAKSLVKLGEKERAVKTLQLYIKTSHSNKAQLLLNNILRGKFK